MCAFIHIKVWSSLLLLRLFWAFVKMQILIQQVQSTAWDSAFLTSSHVRCTHIWPGTCFKSGPSKCTWGCTCWYLAGPCIMLSLSVMSNSLWSHGLQPTRLLCPWDSPGKNTGVGCQALLQGIFPMQGSNLHLLHLLHWQVGSLPLVPPGKPMAGPYHQPLSRSGHKRHPSQEMGRSQSLNWKGVTLAWALGAKKKKKKTGKCIFFQLQIRN